MKFAATDIFGGRKLRRDFTYVVIDTLNYELSAYALRKSQQEFATENVLVFSDDQTRWIENEIIRIPEIRTTADYNRVIFFELPKHLKTDYAIFIQYDGFVLSGAHFSKFFLNYDYIGAPWPHHQEFNVGNGGFSMRSARLVNAVQNFILPDDLNIAEDLVICRYLRARLEDKIGLTFAPESMAEQFSFEMYPVKHKTFGFHGLFNLPSIMGTDIQILFDHLQPKTAVRFFRAFRDACEALPMPERELFYNYCKIHSDELMQAAKAAARAQSA